VSPARHLRRRRSGGPVARPCAPSVIHGPGERIRDTDAVTRIMYADRRPYAVPTALDVLAGPLVGMVDLPARLAWTGRTRYDLTSEADRAVMYERVLVEAGSIDDLVHLINGRELLRVWSRLYLPRQVRRAWEERFHDLATAA